MRRLFAWYVNQNFRENVVPRLPLLFNEYQKFITKKYGIKSDQNEIHLFLSGKLLHLILSALKYSLSPLTGKEKSEKNDSIYPITNWHKSSLIAFFVKPIIEQKLLTGH